MHMVNSRQAPDEGEKWKIQVPRELTRVSQSNMNDLYLDVKRTH